MTRIVAIVLLCCSLAACGDDSGGSEEPGGATSSRPGPSAGATEPGEPEPTPSASSTLEAVGLEVEVIPGEFGELDELVLAGNTLYVVSDDTTVEVDLTAGAVVRTLPFGGDEVATDGSTLWSYAVDDSGGEEAITVQSLDLESGEVSAGPRVPVPFNVLGPELAGGFLWWGYVGSSTLLRQDPDGTTFTEVDGVATEFRDLQGSGERLWMPADEGLVVATAEEIPKVVVTAPLGDASVNEVVVGGSETLAPGAASVERFDPMTGESLGSIVTPFNVGQVASGPAGLWASSISLVEGTVALLDPETGEVLARLDGVTPSSALAVGDESAYAVLAEGDSEVYSLYVLTSQ